MYIGGVIYSASLKLQPHRSTTFDYVDTAIDNSETAEHQGALLYHSSGPLPGSTSGLMGSQNVFDVAGFPVPTQVSTPVTTITFRGIKYVCKCRHVHSCNKHCS